MVDRHEELDIHVGLRLMRPESEPGISASNQLQMPSETDEKQEKEHGVNV